MSVSPKKYISRSGRIIRVVKVTDKNYRDVFNYILRNAKNIVVRDTEKDRNVASVDIAPGGDETNHKLTFHFQGRGIRVAHVGDYVGFEVGADNKIVDWRAFIVKEEIFINKGYAFTK